MPRRLNSTQTASAAPTAKTAHPAKQQGHEPPKSAVLPIDIAVTGNEYVIDDVPYKRVTSVVSTGVPNPILGMWMKKIVAETAIENIDFLPDLIDRTGTDGAAKWLKDSTYRQRDAAGKQGTQLHEIAESIILGTPLDESVQQALTENEALVAMRGHVEQFMTEIVPPEDWTHVESLVWHPEAGYAGTLDGIFTTDHPEIVAGVRTALGHTFDPSQPKPVTVLADWKTSKHVYDSYALQLSAYRYAPKMLDPNSKGIVDRTPDMIDAAVVIHVRPEGWELTVVETSERVFEVFRNAIRVADWIGYGRGDNGISGEVVSNFPILKGRA